MSVRFGSKILSELKVVSIMYRYEAFNLLNAVHFTQNKAMYLTNEVKINQVHHNIHSLVELENVCNSKKTQKKFLRIQ